MTPETIYYLVIFCMVVGGGGSMFMIGWLVGDTMGYAKAVYEREAEQDVFSVDYETRLGHEEELCQ